MGNRAGAGEFAGAIAGHARLSALAVDSISPGVAHFLV